MKPISRTAFYCCGVRMQDAESQDPLCGDTFARRFMSEEGLRVLETFKDQTNANAGNVVRHRVIDDLLRAELSARPDTLVVIIGAGFDTRAYRLKGGSWVELDEPQVIAYKNERLPVSESENELQRIAIDFSADKLEEKLSAFSDREQVLVVIEGVLMYLEEGAIRELLQTLRRVFPRHRLICDLSTRQFFEEYGQPVHEKIKDLGAVFCFTPDDPEEIFGQNGYCRVDKISVVERSLDLRPPEAPKEEVLKTLPRPLIEGYSIYVFKPC